MRLLKRFCKVFCSFILFRHLLNPFYAKFSKKTLEPLIFNQLRLNLFINSLIFLLFSFEDFFAKSYFPLIFSVFLCVFLFFLCFFLSKFWRFISPLLFLLNIAFSLQFIKFSHTKSSFLQGYFKALWTFQLLPFIPLSFLQSLFLIFELIFIFFSSKIDDFSLLFSFEGLIFLLIFFMSLLNFLQEQHRKNQFSKAFVQKIKDSDILKAFFTQEIKGNSGLLALVSLKKNELEIKGITNNLKKLLKISEGKGMDFLQCLKSFELSNSSCFYDILKTSFISKNPEIFRINSLENPNTFDVFLSFFSLETEKYALLSFIEISSIITEEMENSDFKNHLLSSISHNLKTPLNAIISLLALLMNRPYLSDEVKTYLKDIKVNSEILQYEINNIMDYSLILTKKLKLFIKEIKLKSLVFDIFSLFRISAEKKNVILSYEIQKNCDELLVNDIERIKQILVNLIGNAIKFTFEGSIKLVIWKDEGGLLVFEVQDSGIGMTTSVKSNLFHINNLQSMTQYEHGVGSIFIKKKMGF